MSVSAQPPCPSCGDSEVLCLGALPHVQVFAGQVVDGSLPAASLYRCLACGLAFRFPVLSRAQYDALYGRISIAAWPDQVARADWGLIVDYLSRNAQAGASVLDFGCHTGGLLARLGSRYVLHGVEVNETAAKVARARSGAQVFESIEQVPHGRLFDFVTAVDVVEHFADPGRALQALLAAVKPGGALIVTTGDSENTLWRLLKSRWWYCYYPEHLAFISERWVRQWLARTGIDSQLVQVERFRYHRLEPWRYARRMLMASFYFAAPGLYAWAVRKLKRALGRPGDVDPPAAGLVRDHVFMVLRREG